MKNQNCLYGVLLFALLLALAGCDVLKPESNKSGSEYGAKSALSLGLTLDKATYSSNETIEADVLLKNTGTGVVTVNARLAVIFLPLENESEFAGELLFVIVSPSGTSATKKGNWRVGRIVESDFMVLWPRRGILGSYELQRYFILDEYGTYSISVMYNNRLDPQKGSDAWKGELVSNTVYFEITP